MNAVLYSRVSSKAQEAEGFSLEAQEKMGHDYAKRNNFDIVKSWKVSESAWREERSNFDELVDYVKKHKDVEHIIFDVTDRMTRNDFDKIKIKKLIRDYGKTIHFARNNKIINKDSDSDVVFMFDIEVAVAQKMSNDISKKTQMGMQEKAEQGIYPSSAPIGYENVIKKSNGDESRIIETDSDRAPLIAKMFRLYSTGKYSYQQVADAVNKDGLRSKKEKKITKATTEVILKNPIYYGGFNWKGKLHKNGKHMPIIDKELFDSVQYVIRGHNRPTQKKHSFPYVGFVACARCGCSITAEIKKKRYIYYHCTSAKGKCGNPAIRQEALEEQLGDYLKPLVIGEERLNAVKTSLKGTFQDENAIRHANVTRLKTQYAQLKNRLDKMYIHNLDDKIDAVSYERNKNDWESQQREMKLQIERYENQDLNYVEQGIKILELANRAYPLYLRQSSEERRILLNILLSNCVLNDGTLCATYRKPFNFIAEGLSRQIWLPTMDSEHYKRHLSKCKEIHILVKMYRLRGRGTSISLYDPLPSRPLPPPPVYKNIVAMAVRVQEYLVENPQRTQTAAGNHFGVTRARVSQLMTILEKIPADLISSLKTTEDQTLIKRFSGKTLLKIAGLSTPEQRLTYIKTTRNRIPPLSAFL